MRFKEPTCGAVVLTQPPAMLSPSIDATRNAPRGGTRSRSSAGRLAAGSNPPANRRSSSAKYCATHHRAAGLAGWTRSITRPATRSRRCTSAIAATSRSRYLGATAPSRRAARRSDRSFNSRISRAPRADLVQEARRAEGPAPAEEVIVERPDPLGHETVELPHLGNLVSAHCLTLVKQRGSVKRDLSYSESCAFPTNATTISA